MKRLRIGALALGMGLACGGASALEPWVTYDDFSATLLDPNKWPDTNLERRRMHENGIMHLVQRDIGPNTSDSGRTGTSWGNSLTRGTPVKQLRASVRVNAVDLASCSTPSANTSVTRVRARLVNTFFNTGNRVTGSNVGDVLAQIYLYRDANSADPAGTMRIEGNVLQCADSTCNNANTIGSTGSMGTATLGQYVALTVEWDRPGKSFRFSRDNGTTWFPVSYSTGTIALDDSAEPGNMFKSTGLRTDVANCASGPRSFAYIDAQFDNAKVNKSAAP
jgi:hypothetical protein